MNNTPSISKSVSVLIVGAGPVGLAMANELGWRGVDYLLVEQGDGRIVFPAGEGIFCRTMEHLRRWGAADEVRHTPLFPVSRPRNVAFSTGLRGHTLALFEGVSNGDPDPDTPEGAMICPKFAFDPALRANALKLGGGELRYGTRLVSFSQDEGAVSAVIEDTASGARTTVQAAYLAACDGASSPVRKALGIRMLGDFASGENFAIYFRAPALDEQLSAHYGAPLTQLHTLGPRRPYLTAVDGRHEWRLSMYVEKGETVDAHAFLVEFLGESTPFEILRAQNWNGHRVVAERFREGRVFLLGDANHLRWPKGGFGANKGIADAVDLGWKLEAALRGWGGDGLLDSYDVERRQIALRYVNEASNNRVFDQMIEPSPELDEDTPAGAAARARLERLIYAYRLREFSTKGVQLGYRYRGSPVCVPDESSLEPPDDHMLYAPSTWPGCRAPHAWLAPGRSSLDLFGRGFVLLRFDASIDVQATVDAFRQWGVPLQVIDIAAPAIAALYEKALVLVRPDGHVAWRGAAAHARPHELAAAITGRASGEAVAAPSHERHHNTEGATA